MSRHSSRTRRTATTATWLLGLAAGAAAIAAAGRTLPFPDGLAPDRLVLWTAEVGPATAGFTAARALAGLLLGWLAVTWLVAVAVRLLHLTVAVRATDALTLPSVRRLADLVAGVAVVAVSLVPATHAGASAPDAPPLVVMRDVGPSTAAATTTTSAPALTTTTTVVTAVTPDPTITDPTRPDPAPVPSARGSHPSGSAAGTDLGAGTWLIASGDTLWDIADTTTTHRLGRPASGTEVLAQLDRLLALNADRLAVPGDADLVFPGQEFLIPRGP